jgi:hypothetical protein
VTSTFATLALARPTFDVPYAEDMAARAFAALDAAGVRTVGPRTLVFDAGAAAAAMAALPRSSYDRLLLLQVTFTDASTTVELARSAPAPLAIWAFPEPRAGGRLRLNSFCGLNLALHALGRDGRNASYLYADPGTVRDDMLHALLGTSLVPASPRPLPRTATPADREAARKALDAVRGASIGLVGEHPGGFDTCRFDDATVSRLTGMGVARVPLGDVFEVARSTPAASVEAARRRVATLEGIDTVDEAQLAKSLTIHAALNDVAQKNRCGALAVRCWPEMFTEYGCAACGPMGMLNGDRMPAACEADVFGAITARLMQEIADEPSWLVDIVDIDAASDTGVFWHCGSAPMSMCDPQAKPAAQIHSNRRMPLLYQFPLKPGRITIARLSQARNEVKLVVAGGEVVRAPMSFTGTSGVVRFDGGAKAAMRGLLDQALEHHVAMVYGEHRGALAALGDAMNVPVVELAA